MSDPRARELGEELGPDEHDPDRGSTWNTITNLEDIEDLVAEQELEDLMAEPSAGELGILSDTDVPGRPG